MVGKIYAEILVDKVCRASESLIDDEQGGFKSVWLCVDEILTLRWICEKTREKKGRVHVGFMNLERGYDRVNREAI